MGSNSIFLDVEPSSQRFQRKLEKILNYTKSNFLTDLTIVVISCSNSASISTPTLVPTINVNKSALACESSYFLKKFRENPRLHKIEIYGIRFETVNKIFEYFYTDSITINQNELKEIIHLAKLFQLDRVLEIAFNYITDNLDIENVLRIRDLCLSFDQLENVKNCDKFVINHFYDVSKSQTFKQIKYKYLKNLITSDDLVVEDEKRIFEIVVQWIDVDIQNRKKKGKELMKVVRFPLMPLEYLHQISDQKIIKATKLSNTIFESIYYLHEKKFRVGQDILKIHDVNPRKYLNSFVNENLVCIGGTDESEQNIKSIEICSDFGSSWNKIDGIDTERARFACCTYKNNIILIGGNGTERLCTKYDLINKTFIELEPLPGDRAQHVATIIHTELFVFGGRKPVNHKSLISLDLNKQNRKWTSFFPINYKWRNKNSSLECRNACTGCSVNDKFYVFGGYRSNSCECYCPQDNSWRSLPKMKEERWGVGSCYDNNKFIYVVGGWDERNDIHLTSMERFDVENEQWSTLKSSIGVGRRGLTLTVFKNQIILIGGKDKDNKKYKTIQKYDSISDSWSHIGNLNSTRSHHCTVNLKF